MKVENVTRDDWIIGGLALLLVLDLLFLPWFSVGGTITIGTATVSVGGSLTATDAPDAWLGVLGVLATVLVIVDLGIERFSPQTQLPVIGESRAVTRLVLVIAAAVFLALKFLFQIGHFSDLGFGFWAAVVLMAGLLYFAVQARNADPVATARPAGPSTP